MTDKAARSLLAYTVRKLRQDFDPFDRGTAAALAIVAGGDTYTQWVRIKNMLWARSRAT